MLLYKSDNRTQKFINYLHSSCKALLATRNIKYSEKSSDVCDVCRTVVPAASINAMIAPYQIE